MALKRNGQGSHTETFTLYAWDSGTNNAMTYKAEKIAVNPFAPTALNDAPMFMKDAKRVPVGTVTIRRSAGSVAGAQTARRHASGCNSPSNVGISSDTVG